MKKLTIVGMGVNAHTLTGEGLAALCSAQAVFGAPRMLAQISHLAVCCCEGYTADAIQAGMEAQNLAHAVLLVSGDTGFYSAAQTLIAAMPHYDITLVPGVSSLNYFFAKLGMAWQDIKLVSCHGRAVNAVDIVRRHAKTFFLTGGNRHLLAQQLINCGFGDLTVYAGENLGDERECITKTEVSRLKQSDALTVLLVENPNACAAVPFGIADDCFVRGSVPMTKAEVRAVTMSKLRPMPHHICYDVGCGTGSVSVELALAAYEGHVFAVDHSADAVALTAENCRKFQLGNVTPICGTAPEALADLPAPDVVFIGGSGGQIEEIFDAVLQKNRQARIVLNAVCLQTLSDATNAFARHNLQAEIVQLNVAQTKQLGKHQLLTAQNPIFILSGGGHAT